MGWILLRAWLTLGTRKQLPCAGRKSHFLGSNFAGMYGVRGAPRRVGAALFLALSLVVFGSCVGGGSQSPQTTSNTNAEPPAVQAAEGSVVFALLADNSLIEASPGSGRVESKTSLGPPFDYPGAGRYLALGRGGKILFALTPRGQDGAFQVAVVDVATARVQSRYSLPEGVMFRSLVVGPKTGRLYLFGNRLGEKIRSDVGDYRQEEVVVAVLDSEGGRLLESQTLREADGKDWLVYEGEVSADESRLFVSYHGDTTTGIDWIAVTPRGLDRCQKRGKFAGGGCISSAHGGVEMYGDRFLVTLGDTPWIEERGKEGKIIRRWNTGLEGNHMLDVTVDDQADRLYAVGSCGYTGGLSRVDFVTGRVKSLAPANTGLATPSAKQRAICGEKVAVGPGSLLVVGKTERSVPQAGVPGSLILVDGANGQIIRSVDTQAEPVDVLAALEPRE